MPAVSVGRGMDSDGGDPHFPAGADHPTGNFAPVGDQYLVKHIREVTAKSRPPRQSCRSPSRLSERISGLAGLFRSAGRAPSRQAQRVPAGGLRRRWAGRLWLYCLYRPGLVRRRGRKEHYVRSGEIEVPAAPHAGGRLDIPISETGLGVPQTDIMKAPPLWTGRYVFVARIRGCSAELDIGQRPPPDQWVENFIPKAHEECMTVYLSFYLSAFGELELICVSCRSGISHGNVGRVSTYIRKTPNLVSPMGAFSAADRLNARTVRVSDGSMMPSSQRRAVA